MNGTDPRDRLAAREELAQMGPVAVTHLIAELRRVPPARKKMSMLVIGASILALPLLLLFLGLVLLMAAADGIFGFSDFGLFDGWNLFGLFDGWNLRERYHERLHQQKWNQIVRALAQLDDARVAGPLAETLPYADAETQPLIVNALRRLLPDLSYDEARALTSEQRQALYHLLALYQGAWSDNNIALCQAVLNVLVLAEDTRAIPAVESIIKEAKAREIQEAAHSALTQLQTIADRQQSSQSLLRGASAPVTPADMLLKPAYGSAAADPQQLLRAGSAQDTPIKNLSQ